MKRQAGVYSLKRGKTEFRFWRLNTTWFAVNVTDPEAVMLEAGCRQDIIEAILIELEVEMKPYKQILQSIKDSL